MSALFVFPTQQQLSLHIIKSFLFINVLKTKALCCALPCLGTETTEAFPLREPDGQITSYAAKDGEGLETHFTPPKAHVQLNPHPSYQNMA